MNTETITGAALRAWARGGYGTEAATELLIRALHGRFASPSQPWIRIEDDGTCWIDWDRINPDTTGALSGGERRLLAIAASIGGGQPVNLNDAVTIDRNTLDLVLAAIAHASGSHQHYTWAGDQLDSAHPWPAQDGQA